MSDEYQFCRKCGAGEDDHFTSWENGVPMVGSYKDAPNGRICSPDVKALNLQVDARGKALVEIQKYVGDGKGWDFDAALIDGMIADAIQGVTDKRGQDGLRLGESRNLPYPRPISDDDAKKRNNEPECTCSIDGTPYCKAKGTGFCKAENPSG